MPYFRNAEPSNNFHLMILSKFCNWKFQLQKTAQRVDIPLASSNISCSYDCLDFRVPEAGLSETPEHPESTKQIRHVVYK